MRRYFVTSTGTEIGKTFVTAALASGARRTGRDVVALKPIASGFDPDNAEHCDTAILLRAQGLPCSDLDRISPWRFAAPLSPDMAAARENRDIDLTAVTRFCRDALAGPAEIVLIEGVGGIMVPLNRRDTVLDWMISLDIPVLLVAGSYLGTLSHTLTAARILQMANLTVRAVILDETPDSTVLLKETADVLRRFIPDAPVIPVGRSIGIESWRDVPELLPLLA